MEQVENEGGIEGAELGLEPARDDLTVKFIISGTTSVM
jgi:hypothetical protein